MLASWSKNSADTAPCSPDAKSEAMIDALCSCVERRRLYARWIMLFLTFGALIGLTVARYVGSDDELRSVVTLIRDTEPLKMNEKDVANATCPCQVCPN